MSSQNLTLAFVVNQSPSEVFAAINRVRDWWAGDIQGGTDQIGDEFTYRHEDMHYSKQRITELVPGKKIVWSVVESKLNFVENKTEWTGTQIIFEIAQKGPVTEVRFTHIGLVPKRECYQACSGGWNYYAGEALKEYIETGKVSESGS